jgi:hypothetical protein
VYIERLWRRESVVNCRTRLLGTRTLLSRHCVDVSTAEQAAPGNIRFELRGEIAGYKQLAAHAQRVNSSQQRSAEQRSFDHNIPKQVTAPGCHTLTLSSRWSHKFVVLVPCQAAS